MVLLLYQVMVLACILSSKGKKTLIKKIKDPNLPNKHNKGGQSQKRYLHLCEESRHAYVKIVSEEVTKTFIKNNMPSCNGIIIAGPANLKNLVYNIMDFRLKAKVIGIYDIQYNGYTGLEEALDAAKDKIQSVQYMKEKKILTETKKSIKVTK